MLSSMLWDCGMCYRIIRLVQPLNLIMGDRGQGGVVRM